MALKARPTWPGWRWLARWGVPVEVLVEVKFDQEAGVYYVAESTLKGLHVEAPTLDDMSRELMTAADELLNEEFSGSIPRRDARVVMQNAVHCGA